MYHTCENPETFLKPVTAELEAFEQDLLDEQAKLERKALHRFRVGHDAAARALLTNHAERRLLDELDLGEDLVRVVEDRTNKQFGIRMPSGRDLAGETYSAESQSMSVGGGLSASVELLPRGHRQLPASTATTATWSATC